MLIILVLCVVLLCVFAFWVCLRVVMANTYCVVLFFVFLPYVTSFSELSILYCPFGILYLYLVQRFGEEEGIGFDLISGDCNRNLLLLSWSSSFLRWRRYVIRSGLWTLLFYLTWVGIIISFYSTDLGYLWSNVIPCLSIGSVKLLGIYSQEKFEHSKREINSSKSKKDNTMAKRKRTKKQTF